MKPEIIKDEYFKRDDAMPDFALNVDGDVLKSQMRRSNIDNVKDSHLAILESRRP